MSLQTKIELVAADEAIYEIEAESGLTASAKEALAGAIAAGGNIEKRTTFRETSPTSFEKGAEYALAFLDNFLSLLDAGISPQEMKIAAITLKKMEYGNLVSLSQSALAKELGMSRQLVNKHFKTLEKKGFFVKEGGHLFVNSTIFVKGLSTRMDAERRANLNAAHDTKNGAFKQTLRSKMATESAQ